uniref:Uncharacterized protein n=1 Tax=Moniliophthora roreri TaxID=221103 RepID=A0A0W0FHR0_MONRR
MALRWTFATPPTSPQSTRFVLPSNSGDMLHLPVELRLQASEGFWGQRQLDVGIGRGIRINKGVVGFGGGMGNGGESSFVNQRFGGESGDEALSVIDVGAEVSVPVSSLSERGHGQMEVIWKGRQYCNGTFESQLIVAGVHHLVCNLETAAFNDSFEKLLLGPEEKHAFDTGFQSVVLISGVPDLIIILFGIEEMKELVGVWLEAIRGSGFRPAGCQQQKRKRWWQMHWT